MAETDGSLWRLHKECYQWALSETAGAPGSRPLGGDDEEATEGHPLHAKDPATIHELEVALSRSVLFQQLKPGQRRTVIDAMTQRACSAGEAISHFTRMLT